MLKAQIAWCTWPSGLRRQIVVLVFRRFEPCRTPKRKNARFERFFFNSQFTIHNSQFTRRPKSLVRILETVLTFYVRTKLQEPFVHCTL